MVFSRYGEWKNHFRQVAQEKNAKLIGHFVKVEGVQTVFEEAYEGPVPTDEYFGFIEDSEAKEKAAHYLMDRLRLGGAEYAHINRKKDFKLIGACFVKTAVNKDGCCLVPF